MTRSKLSTQVAVLVVAMVALLSTGLPGALHRTLAHRHAAHAEPATLVHACDHTHHDHDDKSSPQDQDHHDDHDCELCLMLATGGQWGIQLAESAVTVFDFVSSAESVPTALIDSLPMPASLARGPPMPIRAG